MSNGKKKRKKNIYFSVEIFQPIKKDSWNGVANETR